MICSSRSARVRSASSIAFNVPGSSGSESVGAAMTRLHHASRHGASFGSGLIHSAAIILAAMVPASRAQREGQRAGSRMPRGVDLFSRRVVGWSMSAAMTAQLVAAALMMAIWRRGKPDALLHHSDRGSQYTSEQFQKLMSDHGVVCSMSRSGNVWDNAAMESFFSSLKTERTARKTYRTRNQAKADVFDYIECFYNPKRRHSTIGYLSPVEFEMKAGFA